MSQLHSFNETQIVSICLKGSKVASEKILAKTGLRDLFIDEKRGKTTNGLSAQKHKREAPHNLRAKQAIDNKDANKSHTKADASSF